MRFAGRVGLNIAKISRMMVHSRGAAVMFLSRIEMRTGRRGIRRRAVAFVVNVETVLARRQILNVGNDLNVISDFSESDRARDFAAGFGIELGRRFGDFLCLRETSNRAQHCYR